MVQGFAQLYHLSDLMFQDDCATHQLRLVLCLLQIKPGITGYVQWWSQTHQRDCTQPGRLNEWPDQKTVKIKVLSSTGPFQSAQLC